MLITTFEIIEYLKKKDSTFVELESKYGLIEHELHDDLFVSVVFNIVGQMLSNVVADKIYNRLLTLCNGVMSPENINSLEREDMRNCGMAYSKVDYIKEFASNYRNGKYDFSQLHELDDESIIKYLRNIKGVGLWTAEMLAMFSLGRENIFSYDDVALRNGIMKAKGFKTLSKKRFESLRKKYSPYCSYAALYFYKVNDDKEF